MAKLEVGEWFRYGDFILHKKEYDYYAIYENGIEKYGRFEMTKNQSDLLKPLETLTPSEALILLANGFVLKKKGYLIKKDNDTIITRRDKEVERGFWHLAALSLLQGFKIHALPEGENG